MKLNLFSMRDRASDVFGTPFFLHSTGAAIRAFGDLVNDPKKEDLVSKHPGDFDLYILGTWDDAQATFEILERPRQVAVGKDLLRATQP